TADVSSSALPAAVEASARTHTVAMAESI
ncbi:MAG: hypothetical protein AVDCRST_MAG93-3413, partial [uncultured Chloroflexia bacterium]